MSIKKTVTWVIIALSAKITSVQTISCTLSTIPINYLIANECSYNITETLSSNLKVHNDKSWNHNECDMIQDSHSTSNYGNFSLSGDIRFTTGKQRYYIGICVSLTTTKHLEIDNILITMKHLSCPRCFTQRYCIISHLQGTPTSHFDLGCLESLYPDFLATKERYIQMTLSARKGRIAILTNTYQFVIPGWEDFNGREVKPCEPDPTVFVEMSNPKESRIYVSQIKGCSSDIVVMRKLRKEPSQRKPEEEKNWKLRLSQGNGPYIVPEIEESNKTFYTAEYSTSNASQLYENPSDYLLLEENILFTVAITPRTITKSRDEGQNTAEVIPSTVATTPSTTTQSGDKSQSTTKATILNMTSEMVNEDEPKPLAKQAYQGEMIITYVMVVIMVTILALAVILAGNAYLKRVKSGILFIYCNCNTHRNYKEPLKRFFRFLDENFNVRVLNNYDLAEESFSDSEGLLRNGTCTDFVIFIRLPSAEGHNEEISASNITKKYPQVKDRNKCVLTFPVSESHDFKKDASWKDFAGWRHYYLMDELEPFIRYISNPFHDTLDIIFSRGVKKTHVNSKMEEYGWTNEAFRLATLTSPTFTATNLINLKSSSYVDLDQLKL